MILGEMYVCLDGMGADLYRTTKRSKGVLGIYSFVASMSDCLWELSSTFISPCPRPICCSLVRSNQTAGPSSLTHWKLSHRRYLWIRLMLAVGFVYRRLSACSYKEWLSHVHILCRVVHLQCLTPRLAHKRPSKKSPSLLTKVGNECRLQCRDGEGKK